MTAEDLHLVVAAMIRESKGTVIPTHIEISGPISQKELDWFLATSPYVYFVQVKNGG